MNSGTVYGRWPGVEPAIPDHTRDDSTTTRTGTSVRPSPAHCLSNTQALRFTGAATASSTNNAADYALTAEARLHQQRRQLGRRSHSNSHPDADSQQRTPTPPTHADPGYQPNLPTVTPGGAVLDVDDDGVAMALTDGLFSCATCSASAAGR